MIKKSILILGLATFTLANTTMCFKKNWTDPSTVEETKLDGGKCLGSKSLIQMKSEGWIVDDMKMSSSKNEEAMNYIYILKKSSDTKVSTTINMKNLKENLAILKKEKDTKIKNEQTKKDLAKGKKIYTSTCARCHGAKADIEAYNSAKALNTLTLDEIEVSIRDYTLDEKDNGMAILMKPYAESLSSKEQVQVYKYIQTLK